MDDAGSVIAFWLLAALTVGAALGVIAVRDLIRALVLLITSFLGVAGLYITLSADFVAVAQVLIYAGAISVLLIFAIMLTPLASRDNAETFLQIPGLLLAGLVAFTIGFISLQTDWSIAERGGFDETASAIGEALLSKYVLPFEMASVLLLVAMLGAIVLVRPEGTPEE
ncbi:MAG: NADH-quinone oxidoreductase subunit J [Dehalococcoidia bacterium]|nr:NADH-quinone oxidoreductase subunit J [Dehalococcoidia bacterium]